LGKAGARAATARHFWELMTTKRHPASAFRLRQVDLSELGDKNVQPLEILVVDTLAELCPEVEWSATQVQSDGGLDFLGLAKSINLHMRSGDIVFRYTIVGQVKRSAKFRSDDLDSTLGKLRRLVRTKKIVVSQLLFVFSSEGGAIARYMIEAPEFAEPVFPGVPVNVIDAADLVWLWAQFGQERFEVLRPAYSDTDFAALVSHLQLLAAEWRVPQLELEVGPPSGRKVVGADLELRVGIRVAASYPGQKLAVQLRPAADVDLVRPLALLAGPQRPALVPIDDHGRAQLSLRLRARSTGVLPLGELDIFLAGGTPGEQRPILTQTLGTIDIAPDPSGRYVRFLPRPNSGSQGALDRLTRSVATRGVEVVAVLGPGGIGKSRSIDELFNRLDPNAGIGGSTLWSLVRVDHDTQRAGVGRFLRDCLRGLAFPHSSPADPRQADTAAAILDWLGRFVGEGSAALKAGLAAIDGKGGEAGAEAAAFILLTAIIARLRDGPIALHLSNMHWTDGFEIDVIIELMHRLAAVERQLPNGVLLILEGREGEMIESRSDSDLTTEAWRRLYESSQTHTRLDLRPWSDEDSRQFLEELIAALAGRRLSDASVQHKIVDHVLKSSFGNPMQIIEHVRLLVDNQWLRIEQDGSAVFDPPVRPPSSLVDLIAARVEFINRGAGNDEIVALLKICAEIGLRTDPDLFGAITNALSDVRLLGSLAHWRVAKVREAEVRDFEFLHEAYREAFRRIGWRPERGERLRRAALARLSPAAEQPPERAVAASRLAQLAPDSDLRAVAGDLEAVLVRHANEPQAVVALCRELLDLPRHVLDWQRRFALVCTLADTLVVYGNWEEALQVVERAQRDLSELGQGHAMEIAQLAYRAGNMLGDVHRMRDGIDCVRQGLRALDEVGPESDPAIVVATRELLENRLGVLLWFSGRLNEGIGHQYRSLRSALKHDPGGERELLFSNEVGMSMTFRYPGRGLRLLDRAVALLEQLGEACDPSNDYARVQRDIARLVLAEEDHAIAAIQEDLAAFLKSGRPSIYAEALGWLTAGACEIALGSPARAKPLFGEAIASAARCRNLRVRWKAHLAYASAAAAADGASSESGHARYAGQLLADSLQHLDDGRRDAWARTIRLPLEQARRLCGGDARLDSVIADIDGGNAPSWLTDWDARPPALSRAGEPFQILHVRHGPSDIFLMG
jgi:hypothetical protein